MKFRKKILASSVTAVLSTGISGCFHDNGSSDSVGSSGSDEKTLSSSTITLTNDNIYLLASGFPGTYIGNGDAADGDTTNDDAMTLVVEPGTLILGNEQEALMITRGSKIQAKGTATDPIVMTSKKQFDNWVAGGDGTSGRGEWAGFALMGYAKTNECGNPCDVEAEGNIGAYGGINDADNSGTIEYVVVRHAGNDIDGLGNELNGFTLFGVGSGTTINHIQVHKGYDDGIEHFGSSDFMDHIVLTGNADDSFDWGQGYTGGAQFIVVKKADDDADRAIEADNDKKNPEATPVSKPILANMTLMGPSNPGTEATGSDGILLRRGTGAHIYNTIITGFPDACIDIDGEATLQEAGTLSDNTDGNLEIHNSLVHCPAKEDFESGDSDIAASDIQTWFNSDADNMTGMAPMLASNGQPTSNSPVLKSSSFAINGASLGTGFVDTDYVGAFDPNGSNWTEGWTVYLNGNTTVWEPAAGGTLNGASPASDGTCPEGTTFVKAIDLPAAVGGGQMDLCQLQRRYDASDIK